MSSVVARSGFYGRPLSRLELDCFKFTETEYAAREHLPKHSHEQDFFTLTLKGNYRENSKQAAHLCSPLTLAFNPAGAEHSVDIGAAPLRVFNIEMKPEWTSRIREFQTTFQPAYVRAECLRGSPSVYLKNTKRWTRLRS